MLKKYRKYLVLSLLIISIIGFIWSFHTFFQEISFIDVTDENRDVITNNLKKKGISTFGVRKIGIGTGWNRHSRYVYYYFRPTKEFISGEGDTFLDNVNLEDKYYYDNESVIVGIISFLTLLIIFIYEIKRKRHR